MNGELFAVIVVCLICLYGIIKKVDIFDTFIEGAKDNIKIAFDIFPSLIFLLIAVSMLRSCGVIGLIADTFSSFFETVGMPADCLPLVLIRSVSGSGALAVLDDILKTNHPDSLTGRIASVMMGSTETTFYTIAVYFSAVKLKCTKNTVIPAIVADIFGFAGAVIFVGLLF